MVATSNRAPWQLNRFGLHEDLFTHFVDKLLQTCDPVQLSSQQDYRRLAPGPQARSPPGCPRALLAAWRPRRPASAHLLLHVKRAGWQAPNWATELLISRQTLQQWLSLLAAQQTGVAPGSR